MGMNDRRSTVNKQILRNFLDEEEWKDDSNLRVVQSVLPTAIPLFDGVFVTIRLVHD